MARTDRGLTLPELAVVCLVMAVLCLLLFQIYRIGASAWMKMEAQTALLQGLQNVGSRVIRDGENSTPLGLTVEPAAISLISARDTATGDLVYDANTGLLVWQAYRVYYFDSASGEVRWLELEMPVPTQAPVPIERCDLGSGWQPLSSYLSGGRVLARGVTEWDVQASSRSLTLIVAGEQKRYGSERLERVDRRYFVLMRN